jgi:hypothetical protein
VEHIVADSGGDVDIGSADERDASRYKVLVTGAPNRVVAPQLRQVGRVNLWQAAAFEQTVLTKQLVALRLSLTHQIESQGRLKHLRRWRLNSNLRLLNWSCGCEVLALVLVPRASSSSSCFPP